MSSTVAAGAPLRTLWGWWQRFWFEPIPAVRVGLLRAWLFGFAVVDVLARDEVSASMGDTPLLFWRPVGLTWILDQFGVGPPSSPQIMTIRLAIVASGVLAALGWRYRFTGPVAAACYLYWQCLGQSWGEMKHSRVTLVLALIFLACVHAEQRRSLDERRIARRTGRLARPAGADLDEPSIDGAWAVRAIQVALAVLYFLSGYSKLRSVGIDWIWGDTLRQAIQDKSSSGEATFFGLFVLRHEWMLVSFQAVALTWELLFPLVFFRRCRYAVLLVGLLFNLGLWTTVRIEFFGVVACFAAFVPLERCEQVVRGWVGRRHRVAETTSVPP